MVKLFAGTQPRPPSRPWAPRNDGVVLEFARDGAELTNSRTCIKSRNEMKMDTLGLLSKMLKPIAGVSHSSRAIHMPGPGVR